MYCAELILSGSSHFFSGRWQKVCCTCKKDKFRKDLFSGEDKLVATLLFIYVINYTIKKLFQRLVHHRNKRPERFEFWFLIIFYSTYFCLFCICLFSAHAVGRWNWWQSFNTISLQCPGRHLSYAGSHWRNNSSGSYEGGILNLIPSLCMSAVHIIHLIFIWHCTIIMYFFCSPTLIKIITLIYLVILFVTDLLFWCFFFCCFCCRPAVESFIPCFNYFTLTV